jgi:hypothetical protein
MISRNRNPDRINNLIDSAVAKLGSEAAVARYAVSAQTTVQRWRKTGVCPLDAQIVLAHAAGLNAEEVLRLAVVEAAQGTPRGQRVAKALGISVRAMGVTWVRQ